MKIPKFRLSSFKLSLLTSLYFTIFLNLAFFRTILNLHPSVDMFVFSIPLAYFLAFFTLMQILFMLPIIHKFIVPALIILSALVGYHSLFFNIYFNTAMLENVLQTTFGESVRMLTFSYVLWVLFFGVLPALIYLCVKVDYLSWQKELLSRTLRVMISLILIVFIGKIFYKDYASFFRNNKNLPHLITPTNFIVSFVKKIKYLKNENIPYKQIGLDAKQDKPDIYNHLLVLVVGETTRAQNWGLNGYRQTTPKLANLGDEVINFSDVSSCATSTAISVPCMFSNLTRKNYDASIASHQDNLLDILSRAGINVVWIENNSDCKGVCKNVKTIDTTALDSKLCTNGECLDEIMLPYIKEVVDNAKSDTLLIVHTIGSHGPTYFERYKPEHRLFSPTCDTNDISKCSADELINTYDNTIVYADDFLDKTIKIIKGRDDLESALLYVSDHGESLGENGIYLHAAPYAIAPKEQTKVPMIMWFSSAFKKNEPFDFKCLKDIAAQSYSHDNIFHTAIGAMDMDANLSVYDKSLDILARCKR